MEHRPTTRPMKKPIDDRYQNQPWYIRLWRRRHYLSVPWNAWRIFRTPWVNPDTDELAEEEPWNTLEIAWSIALGTASGKMNWYYTWDEVKERLAKKKKHV